MMLQLKNREDAKLIQESKRDRKSYGKLYRKYSSNIYQYLWHRVGRSKEIAEDLMQETFLRGFRSISRFRHRGFSYLTYLTRIAHNLLVNYYRKPKSTSLSDIEKKILNEKEDIEKLMDQSFQKERIQNAIKNLSKKEQDVLNMRYQKELSIQEIAARLNKSENAVKLRLSRARKHLIKYL